MTAQFISLLGAAILSIIFGFVALLTQKIYLDPQTQKATEIEVKFFGKMKSNYPSLVFVFLGFALIFYLIYHLGMTQPISWKVLGNFNSEDPNLEWTANNLTVFPCGFEASVNKDTGDYEIRLEIEEGSTFEEKFEVITYTDKSGSATIIPRLELEKYNRDGSGLLKTKTSTLRIYKPVTLEKMPN